MATASLATAPSTLARSRILVQGRRRYACWHAGRRRSNTPLVTLRVFDKMLRDVVGDGAYFVKRSDHIVVYDPTLPSAVWPRTMDLAWFNVDGQWQQLVAIPASNAGLSLRLAKN